MEVIMHNLFSTIKMKSNNLALLLKKKFNKILAQIVRIKKGSKTKCLETRTGVAPSRYRCAHRDRRSWASRFTMLIGTS